MSQRKLKLYDPQTKLIIDVPVPLDATFGDVRSIFRTTHGGLSDLQTSKLELWKVSHFSYHSL
jgi:hypothetical protein